MLDAVAQKDVPMTSKRDKLQGQWVGSANGSNSGMVVLDLDELEDGYEGHAYLYDEAPGLPNVVAKIELGNKGVIHEKITCEVFPIHPSLPLRLSALDLAQDFPQVSFPQFVNIDLRLESDGIHASWETNIGTSGSAVLGFSQSQEPSQVDVLPDVIDWAAFKSYALGLKPREFIFRGQDKPYRLRTSFHRTRRKDLIKYLLDDIPNALHVLTSQTKHLFDLNDNRQNGAFYNLLQHHGYPTPLLDWTYSPFVAAFFAFRFRRNRASNDKNVRILMFDKSGWEDTFASTLSIAHARPHFSLLEPLSIENLRALPQQSVSSVTNMDDVESHIQMGERIQGRKFLYAVDLPFSERRKVLQELSLMGITAGSLFPGLDGACEELRGRFFHPFD